MADHRSLLRLPEVPSVSPLSISFGDLQGELEEKCARVATTAVQRGFSPPPVAEVLEYMYKPLPPTPQPKAVFRELQETMLSSVNARMPCVSLLPEDLPASCNASVKTSFTRRSTVNVRGREIPLRSVNTRFAHISRLPESLPASCSASIRSSFTQQSMAWTGAETQPDRRATWLNRMQKRDGGNQKLRNMALAITPKLE